MKKEKYLMQYRQLVIIILEQDLNQCKKIALPIISVIFLTINFKLFKALLEGGEA